MQEVLKLAPVFKERLWGGTRLKDLFNYPIPSNLTGECWAISAHPHGTSIITNGAFRGRTLDDVFQHEKYLFNHTPLSRFPLLTKILDANQDLSVQVHPKDAYALKHENDLGKTECWYILDCKEDATMIYGHTARNKEELIEAINRNEWSDLLRHIPIHKGDFFYVPAGTVHALCEGTLVLETQQSSDTTYRLYDYDRKDANGNLRPLHIKEALDVITTPHQDYMIDPVTYKTKEASITVFIKDTYFTVSKWDVHGTYRYTHDIYHLLSVIEGQGHINGEKVKKGDHVIVTSAAKSIYVSGDLTLIASHP